MGVGGQRHAPAVLPPGMTQYPLCRRLGGPHGRSGRVLKISPPPGFDPRTVQPVASRCTDWAIAAHGEPKFSVKSSPIATLSTNPTWTGLGLNLGFCGERPVTESWCFQCLFYVLYFVLEIITEWYWTRPEGSYSKQYNNYSTSKQTCTSDIITYMYRTSQDTD